MNHDSMLRLQANDAIQRAMCRIRQHRARAERISVQAKRYTVRLNAEGRVRAYRVTERLLHRLLKEVV